MIEIVYAAFFFVGLIATLLRLLAPALPAEPGGAPSTRGGWIGVAAAGGGAGGLLSRLVLDVGTAGSLIAFGGWFLLLGSLARWGLATIERADEREAFERAKLVGMTAVVSAGIQAGKVGQVTVQYAGMTRSLDASSDEDIEREAEVVIDDVIGGALRVSRKIDTAEEEIPE